MQTLGLSESTPRTENRLKSLFWPSIQSGADVDYLGAQGYWLCAVVAVFNAVVASATGHPIAGVMACLVYYLSGVGIRERSRFAAAIAFIFSVMDMVAAGPRVFNVLFAALLLSNFRATWIASSWKPESEEAALPPRLGATLPDKFSDQLPAWLWPKLRVVYYIFAICFLLLVIVGLVMMARAGHPDAVVR